jgi:stage II sporulation protein AA (anti-sigma F factor antagonist)
MPNEPTGIVASCETRGEQTWIHLEGEFDHEGCEQVAPVLLRAGGAGTVVVDMSRVTFVASEGIGLVLRAHRKLREQGRTLLLRGLRPHIRRSFEIVGVFKVVPEWNDDLSHDEAELLMSKTWDGEITSAEADRLVAHLQHCRECARKGLEMGRLLQRIDQSLKRRREEGGPS